MSGNHEGKKDQPPPPQEEEKDVMQAGAQAKSGAVAQQSDATPVPPWTGYGRFRMVMS